MAETVSALASHLSKGRFDRGGSVEITLSEVTPFTLTQIAAWPDSLHKAAEKIAEIAGCSAAPGPGKASGGTKGMLLRVEPLKWWLIAAIGGDDAASNTVSGMTVLDLSAARTWIRLDGPKATVLLNHFLPLNLSNPSFPAGTVASSTIHHVGVTLWRDDASYNLFLPRSFAAYLWELLTETAAQYGYEVV